jgi:hypothetical protein
MLCCFVLCVTKADAGLQSPLWWRTDTSSVCDTQPRLVNLLMPDLQGQPQQSGQTPCASPGTDTQCKQEHPQPDTSHFCKRMSQACTGQPSAQLLYTLHNTHLSGTQVSTHKWA